MSIVTYEKDGAVGVVTLAKPPHRFDADHRGAQQRGEQDHVGRLQRRDGELPADQPQVAGEDGQHIDDKWGRHSQQRPARGSLGGTTPQGGPARGPPGQPLQALLAISDRLLYR